MVAPPTSKFPWHGYVQNMYKGLKITLAGILLRVIDPFLGTVSGALCERKMHVCMRIPFFFPSRAQCAEYEC